MEKDVSIEGLLDENRRLAKMLEDSAEVIKYQSEWIECLNSMNNRNVSNKEVQLMALLESLIASVLSECRKVECKFL